jgi:hypothetical protein
MVFKPYGNYEQREAIPEPIRSARRGAPAERQGGRENNREVFLALTQREGL